MVQDTQMGTGQWLVVVTEDAIPGPSGIPSPSANSMAGGQGTVTKAGGPPSKSRASPCQERVYRHIEAAKKKPSALAGFHLTQNHCGRMIIRQLNSARKE
jgi:hypothetical protein